jgi:hypothetical protein
MLRDEDLQQAEGWQKEAESKEGKLNSGGADAILLPPCVRGERNNRSLGIAINPDSKIVASGYLRF